MATLKTKQNDLSVDAYIANITNVARRQDCKTLAAMMQKISKHKPKMWGTSIVGFGSYHYQYESGHEGDACRIGFSSRATALTLYIGCDGSQSAQYAALLARLGRHKVDKSCLYIRRLSDVDAAVLSQIIQLGLDEMAGRYPG